MNLVLTWPELYGRNKKGDNLGLKGHMDGLKYIIGWWRFEKIFDVRGHPLIA